MARWPALSSAVLSALIAASAFASPPAPSNVVADPPSQCGSITLRWDPVPGVLGYEIRRQGDLIAAIGGATTRYIDTDASNPIVYNYCIRAFDASGGSPDACSSSSQFVSDMNVDPVDWFQDAFPSNDDPSLPGTSAFDTTTAFVRTGHNFAPCNGTQPRQLIPGEYCYIATPVGNGLERVDLVFRIFPGPGNYLVPGNRTSGLRRIPSSPASGVATPGDGTFWGTTMASPGTYSTPGAAALHAAAPSGWNVHVWNSARCDSVVSGLYRTSHVVGGLPVSLLPSALFTPGSHVEYFFRMRFVSGQVVLFPDTDCVMQVHTQHSSDGHRWEQFSVLPDRWKAPVYLGAQNACALVVDLVDGVGEERQWVGTADSLGATAASHFGASTGWHAVGFVAGEAPVDLDDPANNYGPSGSGFVAANLGQPGTTWDLYNVRGGQNNCLGNAGALGSRIGCSPAGTHPSGPTIAMLEAYYRIVLLLSGDRSSQIMGPIYDRCQDDYSLFKDYLHTSSLVAPRMIVAQGSGFAASENGPFLHDFLGATLDDPNYRTFSTNANPVVPLTFTASLYNCGIDADRFMLYIPPFLPNNVVSPWGGAPEAVRSVYYEDVGIHGPYGAGVYKPAVAAHPWVALLQTWLLVQFDGWLGSASYGRLAYDHCLLSSLVDPLCPLTGAPVSTLDVPNEPGGASSLRLLAVRNNPLEAGDAIVEFAVGAPERLSVQVLDAAGRLVRSLAERGFESGPQSIAWDGLDDRGRPVPHGAYFARVRSIASGATIVRKLIVLKAAGR